MSLNSRLRGHSRWNWDTRSNSSKTLGTGSGEIEEMRKLIRMKTRNPNQSHLCSSWIDTDRIVPWWLIVALHTGSNSEDELAPPVAATSTSSASATSPLTPSKKALARQRAKLRKQSSSNLNGNGNGDDSEASSIGPASSSIPPVPTLPSKLQVNGAAEKVVKATVQAKDKLVEEIKGSVPTKAADSVPPSSSVSESDIESQAGYDDEDEDDDDDEEEASVAAVPATSNNEPTSDSNTPTPSSPKISSRSPATSTTVVNHKPKEAYTGADHDPNKKIKAVIQRTVWGVFMAGGCIGLVAMGHVYVVALVFIIQAIVFRELTGLFDAGYSGAHVNEEGKIVRSPEKEAKRKGRKEERERWSRRMAW